MDGYFKHSRSLLQRTARDKRLTAADRQILDAALLNTRNPGDPVGLGIDFLITESHLARRTVIRARRHLAELGYLVPGQSGKRGLSCFIVATGASDDTCTGATDDTPPNPRGATEDTGTGATGDTGTSVMDGTHIETGNIETTTYAQNDEKPPSSSAPEATSSNKNSESEPKGKSSTQGNQTPPQSPSPDSGGGEAKPSVPKVTWNGQRLAVPGALLESWREAYPHVDLDMAIKRASSWCLSNPGKRPKKNFTKFLNGWLGRVKSSSPEYIDPEEKAASDAELIRGAEMSFDDPDERADYWWRCKCRGEYVPLGVECRPMPAEKEVEV